MKNWTIGLRIGVALFALGFLAAIGGIVALIALKQVRARTDVVANSYLPGVIDISKAYFVTLENTSLTYRHIASNDAGDMKKISEEISGNVAEQKRALASFDRRLHTDEIQALVGTMTAVRDKYIAARNSALDLSTQKKDEAYAYTRKNIAPIGVEYRNAVEAIIAKVEKDSTTAADEAARIGRLGLTLSLSCFGLALAAGIGGSIVIVRGINQSLRNVADSLGQASVQVTAASGQVSGSSQSLAQGASEQAASLEETSASMEEINGMTKRNAENALTAKTIAQETRHAADQGTSQMGEMQEAMNAIKASSDNISKIVKSIDEIAFQTNILALNAAVEAARAGEAGMGFAVVADEVRNLAQRAAGAARETAEKIEDSIQKSAAGVEISSRVAASLTAIAEKAHKVDELVAEISTASQEQTQGLDQISKAMGQMDQVTQSNASNAEETAAAAEELNAQAMSMSESVTGLMKLVGGSGSKENEELERKMAGTSAGKPAAESVGQKPAHRGGELKKPILSHAGSSDFRNL